jgi:hypothetical protein
MDLAEVLAQLHAELENLDAAIVSLERIQEGSRRPARPSDRLSKTRGASARGGPTETEASPKKGRRRPAGHDDVA